MFWGIHYTQKEVSKSEYLDPQRVFAFVFFFFFSFFSCVLCFLRQITLFTHCLRNPQPLYLEKNIKNGSHGTIHTFKNYFAIVFLIFSFQFQQK